MIPPSASHLVLIPSYNPGGRVVATVRAVLARWQPVWVVSDGSTDGSTEALEALARTEPGLRVLRRARNGGKGAAVLAGAEAALAAGFTHALVLDADGQHPAGRIAEFMAASAAAPAAAILGRPVFGADAPAVRRQGRRLSVGLVRFEILGPGIDDPLFGFRVYPLAPLVRVLRGTRGARRYDFDAEAAVRLVWAGVPTVNLPAECRYLAAAEGGVSHFRSGRDNLRMVWLHPRLIAELLLRRWPAVRRFRRAAAGPALPRLVLLLCCAALPLRAGEPPAGPPAEPGPVLVTGENDAGWRPLFAALAAKGAVESAFTERRWFRIRKEPVVLTGVMRFSPARGLSLAYREPERRTVIADAQGLLLRDAHGRSRAVPADARSAGAVAALLPVMRFDLAALAAAFEVHAARAGGAWRLDFVPRDPAQARVLGRLIVFGEDESVRRLEFRMSARQRVEIVIGETRTGVAFGAEDEKQFFR